MLMSITFYLRKVRIINSRIKVIIVTHKILKNCRRVIIIMKNIKSVNLAIGLEIAKEKLIKNLKS